MSCDLCGQGTKVVQTTTHEKGKGVVTHEQEIELLPVADVNKRLVRAMRKFRQGVNDPFVIVMGWRLYVQAEHAHACAARMMDGPRSDGRFRMFGVDVLLDPRTMRDEVRVLAKPDAELLRTVADLPENSGELTEPEKAEKYKETAELLWQILDDIDTLDDACKDNDRAFRDATRKRQQRRHKYLTSYDGYGLTWPWEPKPDDWPGEPDEATDG